MLASYDYVDPKLNALVSPPEDVEALGAVLADPGIGGFEVTASLNEPSHVVLRTVETFFSGRRREDFLLFYFTGHGLKDERGRLFFAMQDTDRRLLNATSLGASFVHEEMQQSRSRCTVLLLDCCYSGAFATTLAMKGDSAIHTPERFAARGRAVLTASDSMQFSFESGPAPVGPPLSIFTRVVVEGLATGAADRDENGHVDLDELYDYVDDRLQESEVAQRPGKWQWDVHGRIVIANNPHDLRVVNARPPATIVKVPRSADGKTVAERATPHIGRRKILAWGSGMAVLAAGGWAGIDLVLPRGAQPWVFETGAPVYSSPAVDGSTVYIGSNDTHLYALDLFTGLPRWAYAADGAITSSPAVDRDLVVVGSNDARVHAVEVETGRRRWVFSTGATIHSSPAVAGGLVVVGSRDGGLYALERDSGAPRWRFTAGAWFNSSPTIAQGIVYVGCRDHNVYAVDLVSGQQRWRYTTESSVDSSATVLQGAVFIGSDDKSLYALEATTGAWIWQFRTLAGVVSTPATDGDAVYFGGDDGSLYALDSTTGRMRWTFPTGNGIRSSPVVADGTVYVGSRDRFVYAVDAATGIVGWRAATKGPVDDSSPVLGGGLVVVGSLDHRVHAFGARNGEWS